VITASFDAATVYALETQIAMEVAAALGIPSWRISVLCTGANQALSHQTPVYLQGKPASIEPQSNEARGRMRKLLAATSSTNVQVTIAPDTSTVAPQPAVLATQLVAQLSDTTKSSPIYQQPLTSQSVATTVVVTNTGNAPPASSSSSSNTNNIIIGVVVGVGGAALLLAAVAFCIQRRSSAVQTVSTSAGGNGRAEQGTKEAPQQGFDGGHPQSTVEMS
jgi:hypothetical protein